MLYMNFGNLKYHLNGKVQEPTSIEYGTILKYGYCQKTHLSFSMFGLSMEVCVFSHARPTVRLSGKRAYFMY